MQLGELRCRAAQALSTYGPGAFQRLDGIVISVRAGTYVADSINVSILAQAIGANTSDCAKRSVARWSLRSGSTSFFAMRLFCGGGGNAGTAELIQEEVAGR